MDEATDLRIHARMLMSYTAWANMTVLDAMAPLNDEQLADQGDKHRGGIAGTMRHVLGAQLAWWSRWTVKQPPEVTHTTPEELRDAFAVSHGLLIDFARGLEADGWDRVFDYRDSERKVQRSRIGWALTHVANHGTLHRGEAGMLLARYGRSPGDLDFHWWARDHWRG